MSARADAPASCAFDVRAGKGGVVFPVNVAPRSSKSGVERILGGALKIRLSSPPVDGAANAQLARVLSKFFGVPKSAVSVISGMSSRKKMVCVKGLTPESALGTALEKLN